MKRRTPEAEARIENLKRLGACLAGGVVLAMMVGTQEGTQQDFGYAFRKAVLDPRIFIFLGIGVLLYLAITFGPRFRPYLTRPGLRPLGAGIITVIVSLTLLKWTDSPQITGGKFRPLADAAADTGSLDSLARLFYGSAVPATIWILLIIAALLAVAGMIRRNATISYVAAGFALLLGIWAQYTSATTSSLRLRARLMTEWTMAALSSSWPRSRMKARSIFSRCTGKRFR